MVSNPQFELTGKPINVRPVLRATRSDKPLAKRPVLPAETLSGDTQALYDVVNDEPDFSVVVVSCAYLDACLGSILEKHFLQSAVSTKLLDPGRGVLGTFTARSDACYALGLISKGIYQDLLVLAELRNQVAHHHLMLSFSTPAVVEACKSLKYAETLVRWDRDDGSLMFQPGQLEDPRTRFVMSVVLMSQRLLLIALGVKRVEKTV
jgi:DNA-binding MltR family transcriptional regulator